MNADDVLVALRRHRDEFARSHGYDLAAMAAALRELDREAGVQVVCRTPRPPVPTLVREAPAPNQSQQQTAHAKDGASSYNVKPA